MKVYMLKDVNRFIGAFSSMELAEAHAERCVAWYTTADHDYAAAHFWIAFAHGAPCRYPFWIYEYDVDRLQNNSYETPTIHALVAPRCEQL